MLSRTHAIMLLLLFIVPVALPAFASAPAPVAGLDLVAVVSRWAHVLVAIVMLGGAVFLRFILMPSVTEAFGENGYKTLRPALMRRWGKVVHVCIALFLVSGFYNYVAVTAPKHPGDALYHALFGVKFLLALPVFALASILVSTRERPSKLRANAGLWLAITVVLAIIVVLIGGVMKLR